MTSKLIKKLGEVVKTVRNQAGLTTINVGDRMAALGHPISNGNISRFERGEQGMTLDRLPIFAEALGVSVSYLFRCAEQGEEDEFARLKSIGPLLKQIGNEVATNPMDKAGEKALRNVLEAQLYWIRSRNRTEPSVK